MVIKILIFFLRYSPQESLHESITSAKVYIVFIKTATWGKTDYIWAYFVIVEGSSLTYIIIMNIYVLEQSA